MPLVILGLMALQYDRANIGNALTDDFLADVGIDQNQYNVGQQLLSVGIVVLEVSFGAGRCHADFADGSRYRVLLFCTGLDRRYG